MLRNNYLAAIRRVEEQLLQNGRENTSFDLGGLVAVFTRRDHRLWLAVFNTEETPLFPNSFEVMSLKQLLEDDRDLSTAYDGMVITFEALGLVRSDIVTRGSRFYPIEQLYRRLNRQGELSQTQLKFARTLFSMLLTNGELEEKIPEYSTTTWFKKVTGLFRLSLPALLEYHQIEGLLAIVPDKNLQIYLEKLQCSMVYIATPTINIAPSSTTILNLEHFASRHIATEVQLCAAFEEAKDFNQGINPRTAGFVDLRKELHRGPYATGIKNTLKQLALLCEQRSRTENRFVQPAYSLAIEYELADQELDDMVGSEFSTNWSTSPNSSLMRSYYLTLSEGASALEGEGMASLDDLLSKSVRTKPDGFVASLSSIRQLFSVRNDNWYPLSDILLRLDCPDVLARSSYLTSRLLRKKNVSIDKEKIFDEAALSCYMYSMAEPYYYYWPNGDHYHQLLQSYDNIHEQFDTFTNKVDDNKLNSYYRALKIWWNYQEHNFKQRQNLLEEAVKELESIKGSEDIQDYPAASQLYELFSALLRMFSNTWRPADIRERLLNAGYNHIVDDSSAVHLDVFNLSLDSKQPSLLFFESLNEFLKLSEDSYKIRIKQPDPGMKAEKLIEIGARLGEQISLNFYHYLRKYSMLNTGLRVNGEHEQIYQAGEEYYIKELEIGEKIEDSFLLPVHERLWMRSLYYSAIDAHAAIIHNLQGKLMHINVTPVEATQYVSTSVEISLTTGEEMLMRGSEVEVILSSSEDYEIQSRVVRKKFGIGLPVKFTVVFHKTGDVALLFEYIVDKREHYPDEAWVHVIGLEKQARKVKNPYQYGDVILSPENYYGRRDDLTQILEELYEMAGGRERQNFRLHGIRRSGKTSLLHMIRKTIEEPETQRYFAIPQEMDKALIKWHPVFYDLQGLPRDPDDRRHLNSTVFFRSLVQKICEALHWSKEDTHTILARINADLTIMQNIVTAAKTQLEQVFKRLPPDERILVLLDEVDLIAPERDERFFGQLRSLILSPELRRITWLLTSIRVLQGDREGVESPLHNIFASITLKNLYPAEARRLILEPARKENIYFESEAVDTILQQTGRQPFFLQVVCHMIVDQLNKEESVYVSKPLADTVIEGLLHPGTVIHEQCGFLWNWAKENRRVILVLLSQHERGMFKGDLVEAFRAVYSTNEEDSDRSLDFSEAWNELFANDLVSQDQDDFCRLTIPMFQQWLKQHDLNLHNLR